MAGKQNKSQTWSKNKRKKHATVWFPTFRAVIKNNDHIFKLFYIFILYDLLKMYKRFCGQRRVHLTNDQQMSLLRRTTLLALYCSLYPRSSFWRWLLVYLGSSVKVRNIDK